MLKGKGIVLTNQYDNNLQREENKMVAVEPSEELVVTEVSQGGKSKSKGRRRRQGCVDPLDKITKKIEQTNKNLSDVIDRGSFAEGNVNCT
jgi:hypothetical protein